MFSNNLRKLRREKNLTQVELAEKLGVANGTVAMWETGKREPDYSMLISLAMFFDVQVDYLLGNMSANTTPHNLSPTTTKVAVYGTIPAGIPIEMIEDTFIEDYEDVDSSLFSNGDKYFCLKVRGESMLPKFEDGDVLVLKQQSDCNNGDFCAVSINHTECTFKKVIKQANGITLQPLNPSFTPMFYSNKDIAQLPITILGVVKEVRRSL